MRSLRAVCLGLLCQVLQLLTSSTDEVCEAVFSGTNHCNLHRRIWRTVFPSFTFQRTYHSLSLYSSFYMFNSLCGSLNFKQAIEPHTPFGLLGGYNWQEALFSESFSPKETGEQVLSAISFFATCLSSVWVSVFALSWGCCGDHG